MSAAEDFAQIRMQFIDPLQHDYEVIRPIVLFGETAAERSRQTGIDRTVIGDKARSFVGFLQFWNKKQRSSLSVCNYVRYRPNIAFH